MGHHRIRLDANPIGVCINLITNAILTGIIKPIYLVLAVLASVAMVTMGTHQVYAPRDCPSCSEFKKLTHEFEKAVTDALPPRVPGNAVNEFRQLLTQFKKDVINAAVSGDFNQISEIVSRQGVSLQGALSRLDEGFGPLDLPDVNTYTQDVLDLFRTPSTSP